MRKLIVSSLLLLSLTNCSSGGDLLPSPQTPVTAEEQEASLPRAMCGEAFVLGVMQPETIRCTPPNTTAPPGLAWRDAVFQRVSVLPPTYDMTSAAWPVAGTDIWMMTATPTQSEPVVYVDVGGDPQDEAQPSTGLGRAPWPEPGRVVLWQDLVAPELDEVGFVCDGMGDALLGNLWLLQSLTAEQFADGYASCQWPQSATEPLSNIGTYPFTVVDEELGEGEGEGGE
jgi:hypothetical protein